MVNSAAVSVKDTVIIRVFRLVWLIEEIAVTLFWPPVWVGFFRDRRTWCALGEFFRSSAHGVMRLLYIISIVYLAVLALAVIFTDPQPIIGAGAVGGMRAGPGYPIGMPPGQSPADVARLEGQGASMVH